MLRPREVTSPSKNRGVSTRISLKVERVREKHKRGNLSYFLRSMADTPHREMSCDRKEGESATDTCLLPKRLEKSAVEEPESKSLGVETDLAVWLI